MTLKTVLEALVFGSPKPLSAKELVAILKSAAEGSENAEEQAMATLGEEPLLVALAELQGEYTAQARGFRLVEQVNGWTLVTDIEAAPWVRQLYPEAKPTRLSGPALETLAIIAYRQPVTRADLEAVRGVAVDGVMQVLLDRGLVKITGRAEVPGRPLLYGTTEYFLQHFGLKSTDELPNSQELKHVALPKAPEPEVVTEGTEGEERKPKRERKAKQEKAEEPREKGRPAEAEPVPVEKAMPGSVADEMTPEERRAAAAFEDEDEEAVDAPTLDTDDDPDATSS